MNEASNEQITGKTIGHRHWVVRRCNWGGIYLDAVYQVYRFHRLQIMGRTMINNNDKTHRTLVREYGRRVAKQILIGAGFANHLHAAVDASEYTRQRLATEIGCSKAALDKWLSGQQYPAVHYLWRICVAIHPNQTIMAYVGYTIKISLER